MLVLVIELKVLPGLLLQNGHLINIFPKIRRRHRPTGPAGLNSGFRASNRSTSRKYVLKTESERLLSTGAIISL